MIAESLFFSAILFTIGVVGVLEDPDAVAHRQHVGERRQPHDDTAERAVTSSVPSAS